MRADLFDSLIVTNFPYPLAHVYRRVRESKESREALCAALQQLLTFVGQVQLLDYLSSESQRDELTEELRRILERPPTAGVWLDWIEQIAAFQKKTSVQSLLGAGDVFTSRAPRKTLHTLVELRNRWAHGNAEFKVSAFRRGLFETMAQISSLHTSSLFCPHSSRMSDELHVFKATRLQGDYAQPAEIEGRSSIALESDRVHLYERNSRQLLSLYPFSLYERCATCEEKHFFVFERVRNRKLAYSAVSGGHEHVSADAYQYLERIFRHKKPSRQQPRHFSIPGEFGSLPRTLGSGDAVGPYRIEELIKIGGMAQVYRATDTRTNAEYALKILPLEMSRDPVLVMRFDEEAHNMQKVEHPNIVKLHDLGEDFGDRYLVFDLAVGGSIGGQQCRDLSDVNGSLPESEILRIGKQVCDALQHIHSLGILHRDLKPGNLLVSGDKILAADFGIARARGDSGMTMTGLPVGTPEYMSPEQVQQEDPDHRSDLYALGCILYALATGRPPFRSDTPLTTAMYHVQASPPRIEDLNPRISKGLCNIIYKLMQKAPRHRHASARELYDDLCAVDQDPAGPQVVVGQKTPQDALEETRARERARAKKRLILVSGLFLVALLIALGGRAAWRSYRLHTLVAQARESWEAGPERWREACAALYDARHIDPSNASLDELLAQVSLYGSLVLETPGREVSFLVEPDIEENGFQWPERLPALLDQLPDELRVTSGQETRLPLGLYHAVPEIDGVRRDELAIPLCITQRVYTKGADGWNRGPRLPPLQAIASDLTATPTPMEFAFGERFHCESLRFPAAVPDGFRFVNSGPFFRAETDFGPTKRSGGGADADGSDGPVTTFSVFELVEDELESGFLMGNETTVAQFEEWFERFGDEFCDWMAENEKVLLGRRTLRQVKAGVRHIPLELQLRHWADELPANVDPATIASSDELMDVVFRDELAEARAKWQAYETRMRATLAQEEHKSMPVGNVDFAAALVFARTHWPIRRAEFVAWIEQEIESAHTNERRLVEWTRELAGASAGPVQQADFPLDLAVGWREGLLTSYAPSDDFWGLYVDSLYYHAYYAIQLPAEAIVEWVDANTELVEPASLREKLPELVAGLALDHQWLYEAGSDGELLYMPIVSTYNLETQVRDEYPRPHCVEWARARIRIERERSARLGELGASLEHGEADDVVDDVPWDFRLEFGWATGWDLPMDRQWEKAFRGADDRPYPWGTVWSETVLGTHEGPSPLEQPSMIDVSPHGIARLGAQVSEWIHLRPGLDSLSGAFLKGGNYRFDGSACNGGHLIRLPRGQAHRWTGFRVIRKLPGEG